MWPILFVALGGSMGALGRYFIAQWLITSPGKWPLATITVNCLGSLLMGVLFVIITQKTLIHPEWRSVLMVGLLGAFTTFSTYSLETVLMIERGEISLAISYALGSVVLCVAAAFLGISLGRYL